MTPRAVRILLILSAFLTGLVLCLAVILLVAGRGAGPIMPTAAAIGGPFKLIDHNGRELTDQDLKGRPFLVFFGFTHCPDVCPTTLARLAQVVKAANVPDLKVLLVSVDPERDTPELLERYVHAFNPDFTGVTGKPEEIERLAKALNVAIAKVDMGGGQYTVDHSAVVTLLNREGQRVVRIALQGGGGVVGGRRPVAERVL